MSINEDRVVWTTEQAKQAVKSFLATLESDGFYDVFADPDIDPSDLTAFRNDDIRRNDGQSAAAQEWWESVRNIATHNSARFLTLAEPLAQYGIALDELYAVIPMECNFNTLTQAFIDCGARPRGVLPLGITNTTRWTDDQLRQKLEEVKKRLDWDNTTDDARRWWEEFENDKINPLRLVLRLAEELATRKATILEFYQSYGSSRTGNIRANLYYLDYIRLKIEHDLKRVIARPESK